MQLAILNHIINYFKHILINIFPLITKENKSHDPFALVHFSAHGAEQLFTLF